MALINNKSWSPQEEDRNSLILVWEQCNLVEWIQKVISAEWNQYWSTDTTVVAVGWIQCCHFWCFHRNFWCLMFLRQIWCWLGCYFCVPHFPYFGNKKLDSQILGFLSMSHQFLSSMCLLIVTNWSSHRCVENNIFWLRMTYFSN